MKQVFLDATPLTPSKIVCVGRNYVEHIEELDNAVPDSPVIFLKPNSAITDTLRCAPHGDLHYESEICFTIRGGKICGVGFGLDLTRRALQSELKRQGLPWGCGFSFFRQKNPRHSGDIDHDTNESQGTAMPAGVPERSGTTAP